jgi:hypothetical protein
LASPPNGWTGAARRRVLSSVKAVAIRRRMPVRSRIQTRRAVYEYTR